MTTAAATTTTTTLNWLRANISQYQFKDIVYNHLNDVLNGFNNIRIKSDIYTYDDGRTQLLLCLFGLLQISYRNASYNIPIAIWIVRDYPRQPPIAYVVPTNDMLVKAGKFIQVSGLCNLEYIQLWERKTEGRNLSALLEAMQELFSRDPPLYAKPKDPPPIPPKPAAPIQSPPVPFEIQRASAIGRVWSPGNGPMISHRYASSAGPISPPPPPPPPPPPRVASPLAAIVPLPPNYLDEESVNSPASSEPPPRPPNPELVRLQTQVHQKIESELASLSQALGIDGDRLRGHQIDLMGGEPAIRDEMSRLEAVREVCRNVAGRMRGLISEAERNVRELRRKGDPEVDELVCCTSIVHNQLINLVAEDNAIEDTIYHLHRALNSGRIDLERFIRTTRILAEDQFMKRALIEKIHSALPSPMPMGMPMGSRWI